MFQLSKAQYKAFCDIHSSLALYIFVATMALSFVIQLVVSLAALAVTYRIYATIVEHSRQRALRKAKGCQPSKAWHPKDPILAIDFFLAWLKHQRASDLLPYLQNGLTTYETNTLRTQILRRYVFLTDDPDNVKAILSLDFNKWSIGAERIRNFERIIGTGIFTAEGTAWKHSREMLRPCFERSQVADVSILAAHTDRLISLLPSDGSTVDLEPLFHKLTMDIATEFLFGKSVESLDPENQNKENEQFRDSFDYVKNPFSEENKNVKRFGVIGAFLPDARFKESVQCIHGKLVVSYLVIFS